MTAVHPHVRGDYGCLSASHILFGGPSPRAWGLPLHLPLRHPRGRSIPTCVGTTVGQLPEEVARRRSIPTCVGTTLPTGRCGVHPTGPSPRAWGLRTALITLSKSLRSIPTCVGTTSSHSGCGPPSRSIPTCVGTTCSWAAPRRCRRSIPTCVGTTPCGGRAFLSTTVHPHVRGDYALPTGLRFSRTGPSPRAWGLRLTGYSAKSSTPVHPHVRGDY